MRFGPRNAYYLRISENTVLPLYIYLDERHIDWMSERVLLHVLEDLRPLVLPKLNAEEDAHLGPGGPANAKRGTVDVHRGDTYQFGYFLRKTDPHAVLVKTRYFVPTPERPQTAMPPNSPSPEPATAQKGKKRTAKPKKAPSKRSKKPKTKGKRRARGSDEEDDAISISSDPSDDGDALPPGDARVAPRRSMRVRKFVAGGYHGQNEDEEADAIMPDVIDVDVDADVEMAPPDQLPEVEPARLPDEQAAALPPALDDSGLITIDDAEDSASVTVKHEDAEPSLTTLDKQAGPAAPKQPISAGDSAVIAPQKDLQEGDEDKSKLALRLKYQGFNIHGRCLCVIIEPFSSIRAMTRELSRAPSLAPAMAPPGDFSLRAPSIAPPDFVPSGGAARRAQTPLFLPEYDRERSVTPAPAFRQQRSLPPVPLFNASMADSDSDDDAIMNFSQLLQSVGEYRAGLVEDDDEIDGAVLFGDADETREL